MLLIVYLITMKTKITPKRLMKLNRWIKDVDHAKKIIAQINYNYKTGQSVSITIGQAIKPAEKRG